MVRSGVEAVGIALVYFGAGVLKLLEPYPAATALRDSLHLTPEVALALVLSIASVELVVGIAMVITVTRSIAAIAGLSLAFGFLTWSIWSHATGHADRCGCFGVLAVLENFWIRCAVVVLLIVGGIDSVRTSIRTTVAS